MGANDSTGTKGRGRGQRTSRKLKVRALKAAKHDGTTYSEDGGGARQQILWDSEISGLGLRVYPSGRKSWVLRYRLGRRRRIVTLGQFGIFTLEEARDYAGEKLLELKKTGKDPLARSAIGETVAEVIPRYLRAKAAEVKESTLATYRTKLNHVSAELGELPIDELGERDLRRMVASVTKNAGPAAAKQCLQQASALLDWSAKRGLRERDAPNPAAAIEPKEIGSAAPRGRKLTSKEMRRLGTELESEEEVRPEAADTVAAIRLLALTGARRREITDLIWREVDLDGKCLRLEDSKTGPRVVALPTPALELLASMRRGDTDERVFPADKHEVGYAIQYTWRRVRERAGLHGVRLHDLRHTFVTRGLGANFSSAVVGNLVGHRSTQTTQRYEHLEANREGLEAAEAIGAEIAADLEGRAGGDVVPIRKK